MTLHRSFGPALVALAALVGCGETTLEPIGDGGGGSGTGGNGAGANGNGGNGANGTTGIGVPSPTNNPDSPVLMVVFGDSRLMMMSDLDRFEFGMITNINSWVESTYHVLGQRDDLVYASASEPGTVDITLQTHAINTDGGLLQQTYTLPLEPVGSVPQVAVDMKFASNFWMLSQPASESPGPGPIGNRLYFAQGDFGPLMDFVSFDANPPIEAWAILPNERSVAASTADGLIQINSTGIDNTIERVDGVVTDRTYAAMASFDRSLYAVTQECGGDCLGELHIWRDLADHSTLDGLIGPPNHVIELPAGTSKASAISVGTRGVLVGTTGAAPQLLLYRVNPKSLSGSATPDEQIALDDDVVEVESVHWGDDDDFGRRLSVYLRGTDAAVRVFEDNEASPLALLGAWFSDDPNGPLLDIHVAD